MHEGSFAAMLRRGYILGDPLYKLIASQWGELCPVKSHPKEGPLRLVPTGCLPLGSC